MRQGCLLLLALHFALAQSINCSNNVDAESRPRTGPGGVVAVLTVHSEDDHSKNSHDCMASYYLRIKFPDGRTTQVPPTGYGFENNDAEWDRRLSVHLDGFSKDGQHIYGVISEGGKYSTVQVFDFKREDGPFKDVQVKHGLPRLKAARCGTSFAVAGTTGAGELVLEPNTADPCRTEHRWVLNAAGELRDLTKNDSFVSLYNSKDR